MPWSWACGQCELLIKEPDKDYIITYNLGDSFPITVPPGTKIGARVVFNYDLPSGSSKVAVVVCQTGVGCYGYSESLPTIPPSGTMDMSVNPLYQNTVVVNQSIDIEVCVGYVVSSGAVATVLCTNSMPIIVAGTGTVEIWHYNEYNFIRDIEDIDLKCTHPMVPPCEMEQNKNMRGHLYYLVSGVGSTSKDLRITFQERIRNLTDPWHDLTSQVVSHISNGDKQADFDFYGRPAGYYDYRWKFEIKDTSSGQWSSLPDEQAYTLPITVRYVSVSACTPGEEQCIGTYIQRCNQLGQWENTTERCDMECTPGETDCNGPGGTKRLCNSVGEWGNTGELCTVCTPGETDCNGIGGTKRLCNAGGQWTETGESCGNGGNGGNGEDNTWTYVAIGAAVIAVAGLAIYLYKREE